LLVFGGVGVGAVLGGINEVSWALADAGSDAHTYTLLSGLPTLPLRHSSSYDAGNIATTGFDPKESFRAHKAAWSSASIALGIEVTALEACFAWATAQEGTASCSAGIPSS
jgi:hypothetical protein